jgi:hypothetical protein
MAYLFFLLKTVREIESVFGNNEFNSLTGEDRFFFSSLASSWIKRLGRTKGRFFVLIFFLLFLQSILSFRKLQSKNE